MKGRGYAPTVPLRPARGSFGVALRGLRARRDWSQERLAEAAGVHDTFVSRLETGVRQPSRETVGHLARALAASPVETAHLFVAAGFVPEGWERLDAARIADIMTMVEAAEEAA